MRFLIIYVFLFLIISCARRGNPTGGPKDEDKPILTQSVPPYKTVNFKENEIKIYFDEYIKLNELESQLIISPPLKYKPIITPLGLPSKKITITIKDTLKDNTTYVFNFGNSLEDNNEGNILSNFNYIFSTGSYIDSLSIKGRIKNAFFEEPEENIMVQLYSMDENYYDSIIYYKKPAYITNTLDSVSWNITNLKEGKYRLFALKDANKDNIYNPLEDEIAFLDTIITLPTDAFFNLSLFKEKREFSVAKPKEIYKGHLIFGFYGAKNNLAIDLINTDQFINENSDLSKLKKAYYFEKDKDTMHFFFKGISADSLKFRFSKMDFSEEKVVKLRLSTIDSLTLRSTIKNTLFKKDTFNLIANTPIIKVNNSKIQLIDKDSVNVAFTSKYINNNVSILFEYKEDQKYSIQFLPNAITNFFEESNDSLKYQFITKKDSYYGSIAIELQSDKYPIISQLLTEEGKLIEEVYVTSPNKIEFSGLPPSNYKLRFIFDQNKNRIWDAGVYLKNKQPEEVFYFNKLIVVKENWFVNETYKIN